MLSWPARLASLAMLRHATVLGHDLIATLHGPYDLVVRDLIRSEDARYLVVGFTDAKGGTS